MEAPTHKLSAKKRFRDADSAGASVDAADASDAARASKRASSQPAPATGGSSQELLSLFTDCISALSTNKICSRNAFEVGIIDHMTDLVHLDGGSDDEDAVEEVVSERGGATGARRLNFTRASKVVESASKIYGYRIEAIYDQTFNVLMNMNNANQSEGSAQTGPAAKARSRMRAKTDFASGSRTLAPEGEVTLSEIPMDNVVLDPYFLKISSMFDQSGAQGLLLTNLQVTDELCLDLDGDSLVFAPPRQLQNDSCEVYVSGDAISAVATAGAGDVAKMEILPEASYFRNELQRLQDLKRRRQGGSVEYAAESQPNTSFDTAADLETTEGDLHLDYLSGVMLSQPDVEVETSFFVSPEIDPGGCDDVLGNSDSSHLHGFGDTTTNALVATASAPVVPWHGSSQDSSHTSIALKQRLAEIDLVGGSQFSYYTSSIREMSGGAMAATDRAAGAEGLSGNRRTERTGRPRDSSYRDIAAFMRSHSCADETKSIECLPGLLPPRAPARQPPGIFTAPDFTGSVFKFSESFLTRLGTLGNRGLRMASDQDWRTHPADNQALPLLQIFYTKDQEAPFSSSRIGENFSWTENDQIDFIDDDDAWRAYEDVVEGTVSDFGLDQLDGDSLHASGSPDEPLDISIEGMYAADTFEPVIPLSQPTEGTAALERGPDAAAGVIVPAPVATYVDIFKIKKTLCSVILPPPDYQEAVDDERLLGGAASAAGPNRETSCMFQRAITETVERLQDSDVVALSSHIMFVCLLHVCNEQDLLLRQEAALEDFHICVGAPKQHHLGNFSG
ncbi:chromosome condensation protein, putative [Babesia caballi]|uniref:Condensin complex subunit 2 n=1 Tax=Babesia caballi TaxID=5871 RepID=A0AAV4LY50_BABCB|nr:chromosome condensation protein, putative [Babesia caballi]